MKHDLLLGELKAFEKDFAVSGGSAGLHILLKDLRGRSEEILAQEAESEDVKVYCMSAFQMKESDMEMTNEKKQKSPATMILGYGGMSEEEIKEGIHRLKKIWIE